MESQKFGELSPWGICLPFWFAGVSIFQRISSLRQNNTYGCFGWRADSSIWKSCLVYLSSVTTVGTALPDGYVSNDFMCSQFCCKVLKFSPQTRPCIRTSSALWSSRFMWNLILCCLGSILRTLYYKDLGIPFHVKLSCSVAKSLKVLLIKRLMYLKSTIH